MYITGRNIRYFYLEGPDKIKQQRYIVGGLYTDATLQQKSRYFYYKILAKTRFLKSSLTKIISEPCSFLKVMTTNLIY